MAHPLPPLDSSLARDPPERYEVVMLRLETPPSARWRAFLLALPSLFLAAEEPDPPGPVLPCPDAEVRHYTAYRATGPITIDGRLEEADWTAAPQSPRFVDLISGERALLDTRAAILWDEAFLYVAFRVEEPFVEGRLTKRNAPIYTENDVEVFLAGADAYYEFEINALGTRYEAFFIWEEAYLPGGFSAAPEFARELLRPFNGVGFTTHPRGPRLGHFDWAFPELQSAVFIDGTLNDNADRDRGWTVELAFPWKGMEWLAKSGNKALPPRDGDVWRIHFSRFNTYREALPAQDSGGWAWSPHGVWDSHVPECFPYIHFSVRPVTEAAESE